MTYSSDSPQRKAALASGEARRARAAEREATAARVAAYLDWREQHGTEHDHQTGRQAIDSGRPAYLTIGGVVCLCDGCADAHGFTDAEAASVAIFGAAGV